VGTGVDRGGREGMEGERGRAGSGGKTGAHPRQEILATPMLPAFGAPVRCDYIDICDEQLYVGLQRASAEAYLVLEIVANVISQISSI